jgi:hypothetical protein
VIARTGGEDPGGLRASDADRDHAIDNLKTAFVHGRLDKDELDLRVGLALAARTQAELRVVTADLPDEVPRTSLPPGRSRPRRSPPVKTAAATMVVATDAGAFALSIAGAVPAVVIFAISFLALGMTGTAVVAALIRGLQLIEAHHARHSGGRLPPPPDATKTEWQRAPGLSNISRTSVGRRGSRTADCGLTVT